MGLGSSTFEMNVFKGRSQRKTGKCGNLKKTGGGSTRIPLPFFTVFNIGDPPLKCKKNMIFFLKQTCHSQTGGRGSPTWEKFPHFPVFFLGERPLVVCLTLIKKAAHATKNIPTVEFCLKNLRNGMPYYFSSLGLPSRLMCLSSGQDITE